MEQGDIVADPDGHRATTVEQGRFCMARCTCGWRGPARRARSLARTDAEGHVVGGRPDHLRQND
ncbi:hypothetical protein [Streptomyces gibsoniae]|uniref:Uncharacterized protein n=1 Tax=Streptomyces gibsoniae TaxID=3075529 RepID=A0ABU2TRF8_9ACTN|nr:hypothetical protein [Streptomyces sp. DSM 41699]MDT0463452.1 hypothetical protein [Streptomyces sp. DSM 41699]